jgi:hypothetical protein
MGNRTSRSLAILCILLIGVVVYLLMSSPQESVVKPSVENTAQSTVASSPDTAAAKGVQKVVPQAKSKPQHPLNAVEPVGQDQIPADFMAEARRALNDADVAVRVQAVRQLRNEASEEAIALLQGCLDDPSTLVAKSALNSLAFIGQKEPFGEKVYGILEGKAMDENFPERGQALVIAALFSGDDRLLPVISDYISADAESDNDCEYPLRCPGIGRHRFAGMRRSVTADSGHLERSGCASNGLSHPGQHRQPRGGSYPAAVPAQYQ